MHKSVSFQGYSPKSEIEGNIKKVVNGWGSFGVLCQDGDLWIEGFGGGGRKSHVLEVCFGWEVLYLIYKADASTLLRVSLQSFQEDQTIPLPEGEVQEVSTSEVELLVLMKDGNLWRYTLEWECILGSASNCKDPLGMNSISQIACGVRHHCALTSDGVVFCWGCNLHNECGLLSKEDVHSPQFVSLMGGLIVTSISAGLHHTIASTQSGDVYSWGSNADGQLGITHSSPLPTLIEAPSLENQSIVKVKKFGSLFVL